MTTLSYADAADPLADSDAPTLWTYGYDRADQLTAAVHQTTGGTASIIKRYAYTYDPAGNRTSEQIDDAVTLATHDFLNRLLTHAPGGALVFKGGLNEPGRVTINGVPAATTAANQFQAAVPLSSGTNTVTINAVDASGNVTEAVYEVDQAGPTKTFTYDANGNMTSDGTRTFEWDARNQLLAINVGTQRSEFFYDGFQRRVLEVDKETGIDVRTTHAIWGRMEPIEYRTGVRTTRKVRHGEQVDGQPKFVSTDHLGSTRQVSANDGLVSEHFDYDPWGRPTAAATDPVTSGFGAYRYFEQAQVWLSVYRAYDSSIGRWLSSVPAGGVDGPNLQLFVENAPRGAVTSMEKELRLLTTDCRRGCVSHHVPSRERARGGWSERRTWLQTASGPHRRARSCCPPGCRRLQKPGHRRSVGCFA